MSMAIGNTSDRGTGGILEGTVQDTADYEFVILWGISRFQNGFDSRGRTIDEDDVDTAEEGKADKLGL